MNQTENIDFTCSRRVQRRAVEKWCAGKEGFPLILQVQRHQEGYFKKIDMEESLRFKDWHEEVENFSSVHIIWKTVITF